MTTPLQVRVDSATARTNLAPPPQEGYGPVSFWLGLVFAFIVGFCIGGAVGESTADYDWELEAVKHDAAEYDQKTGRWKWKETPWQHQR